MTDQPEILLLNKSDLPEHADWKDADALRISCLTENGLSGLEEEIIETNHARKSARGERGRDQRAPSRLSAARSGVLRSARAERMKERSRRNYVAVDLRDALHAVGEVIGAVETRRNSRLRLRQFCIGK